MTTPSPTTSDLRHWCKAAGLPLNHQTMSLALWAFEAGWGSRDRAALAQEQQGAPTDEELLQLGCESVGYEYSESWMDGDAAMEAYGGELIAFARAVLERWGGRG